MSYRNELNSYIERLHHRLRLGAWLRGEAIFTSTHKYAGPFVGNNLNCSNCHLDRGRRPCN